MADHGGAHRARLPAGRRPRRRGAGNRAGAALLGGIVLWVVCLNGGTLALNSAFDRDEGDVAYLKRPPPPPRHLAAFSLGLMGAGQLLALAPPDSVRRGLRRLRGPLGSLFRPALPTQGGRGRRLAHQHVGLRHADALRRLGDDGAPARCRARHWSSSASAPCSPRSTRSPSSISSRRTRDGETGPSPWCSGPAEVSIVAIASRAPRLRPVLRRRHRSSRDSGPAGGALLSLARRADPLAALVERDDPAAASAWHVSGTRSMGRDGPGGTPGLGLSRPLGRLGRGSVYFARTNPFRRRHDLGGGAAARPRRDRRALDRAGGGPAGAARVPRRARVLPREPVSSMARSSSSCWRSSCSPASRQ